ncbi:MAG: 16S rRNA (uracil(1498)-N(3))-methyltransferase [Clostridia bacterium]|nr:16S rRNA (uracil(1498)-N(3))-methyltransferase [Clostridia bacterium]
MYNFFVSEAARGGDVYFITGADHNHIKNVLRMHAGNTILVSENGASHLCEIIDITETAVTAKIIEENYNETELPIKIYLFQGLPKSDKMELIIQKAVELGVYAVVPVEMHRSVVKLDEKKKESRRQRWQAIAESAAKQSKRNVIPEVCDVLSYKQAMAKAAELDVFLVPYENEKGMLATKEALEKITRGARVGILIGPEGGFEPKEVAEAAQAGGMPISLGARILRAETAAIASVGMCMLHAEMNL